jgi:hypothetical protein
MDYACVNCTVPQEKPLLEILITLPLLATTLEDNSITAAHEIEGIVTALKDEGSLSELDNTLVTSQEGATVSESSKNVEDPFPSGFNLDWMGSLSDNLRLTFDMSGRFEYDTNREEWSISQYYGFDLFKVLSNKQGDYATILLQGYATGLDNNPAPPFIFDGPNDWQWIYRMFYINWKLAPRDALNLKVGHFEMPFGLEMDIDTNGTLRQLGTAPNLGIKADWGLTLNGVSSGLEYEFGISRGSGFEWETAGSPYAFVGRVGTDPTNGSWVGVSGFTAELYRPGTTIQRRRIGVDAGLDFGAWTLMGEVSGGNNGSNDALHMIGELNWRDPSEQWFGYGQLRTLKEKNSATGWEGKTESVLGVEWAPDRHWTMSAEWVQNLERTSSGSRDASIRFQMRYRF